ncbi:hypothetical protein RB195_015616 [Necator americanus]
MSRLRDSAEYVSKAKRRWAGHIMKRIDDRWTERTLDSGSQEMLNALEGDRQQDGVFATRMPAESSAGYGSRTSSTSLTKLENIWTNMDDNGEGTKRVEEMWGPHVQ